MKLKAEVRQMRAGRLLLIYDWVAEVDGGGHDGGGHNELGE